MRLRIASYCVALFHTDSDCFVKQHTASSTELRTNRGMALAELAMVLPLLVLIFAGTVEYSRMFSAKEIMALAAREAANKAFRECFDTQQSMCTNSQTRLDACLNYYAGEIFEVVKKVLPSVTLTVSMYTLDQKTGFPNRIGITFDPANNNSTETRFDSAIVEGNLKQVLQKQNVVVISEVFYDFPVLFRFDFIPKVQLYEAAIL
jgi:hypothetical protein